VTTIWKTPTVLADLNDLAKQAMTGTSGRGGRRPGAGRKRKDGTKNIAEKTIVSCVEVRDVDTLLAEGVPPPLLPDRAHSLDDHGAIDFNMPDDPVALFAGAKARKEAALAAKAELEFRVKSGQYLPRDAIKSGMATVFQSVAQSLRSIPDSLERKLGMPPEVAEQVGISIDEILGDLAAELEKLHLKNHESTFQD